MRASLATVLQDRIYRIIGIETDWHQSILITLLVTSSLFHPP